MPSRRQRKWKRRDAENCEILGGVDLGVGATLQRGLDWPRRVSPAQSSRSFRPEPTVVVSTLGLVTAKPPQGTSKESEAGRQSSRMVAKDKMDYSLYLVTGRELLPPGADYYQHLEQTLAARKVTVVQVREKHADNGEFLEIAKRTLAICDKVSIALVSNRPSSLRLKHRCVYISSTRFLCSSTTICPSPCVFPIA